jgi:hypothetical protein
MADWQAGLDERQRKEIELARVYTRDFNHGTDGHSRLTLIANLAETLDRFAVGPGIPPQPALEYTVLDVPYHSQHEADAKLFRKDCGPACVEAVGKFYVPTATATTNEIMRFTTGGADRATYIAELQKASVHFFNVTLDRHDGATWEDLVGWIIAGKPVPVLVHYGSFGTRLDRDWWIGHYLVVVGVDRIRYQAQMVDRVILHDPDYWGSVMAQGAFIPVIKDHFMGMWDDCYKDGNPRRMALVPRVSL